jgi:hypothetical protein
MLSGNSSHFTVLNGTAGGPAPGVIRFFVCRCPRVLVKCVAVRKRILSKLQTVLEMVSFGQQIRVTRKSWMKVGAFQATAFRYFA